MFPARYSERSILGIGAMGIVYEVHDETLSRTVAMKVLLDEVQDEATYEARFRDEALLMANLEHPNIVPVYDRGVLADGRPWFTMRKVQGQDLELYLTYQRHDEPDPAVALRRCIEVLRSVSQGLAFAHARGAIHRDVKPENILLGSLGEVYLMDWGIARARALLRELEPATEQAPRQGTQLGTAVGTVSYMAPEQASGRPETHGPWSDVFAVGAILYHVLVNAPPFAGDDAFNRVRRGKIPDVAVSLRRAGLDAPETLVSLCRRCMALRPQERPEASEVARSLVGWLDGQQRTAQARARVVLAREALAAAAAARERKGPTQARLEAVAETVKPWDPLEKKRELRQLERALVLHEQEGLEAEIRAEHELQAALRTAPDLDEAHEVIADLYQSLMLRAEQDKREHEALRYQSLLGLHGRKRHIAWLSSPARLTLHTDPPGATVTAFRVVPGEFRHEEHRWKVLGQTPLDALELPPGNYMLTLDAPGHHLTRYPVTVGRGEHWHGRPPGWERPFPIPLPTLGTLMDDERYVPGGWFSCGTSSPSMDALPLRRLWVDGFILGATPVTFGEYLTYLNNLLEQGEREEAFRRLPVYPDSTGSQERPRIVFEDVSFRIVNGPSDRARFPVVLVAPDDCDAYLTWLTSKEHHGWRLPHEFEWEKAARGTDGRLFPWGDHMEPTFTSMLTSFVGAPRPCSVDELPHDISPFEVGGMGGNVREWCLNPYLKNAVSDLSRLFPRTELNNTHQSNRGGSYNSGKLYCRVTDRFASRSGRRYAVVGFRKLRGWGTAPRLRAAD